MIYEFSRSQMLLGSEAMEKLAKSSVILFGVGGVGSYCAEALARTGVGKICLVDGDKVTLTNINRQLVATHKTIGMPKVLVAKDRILDINPSCEVTVHECFYGPENEDNINLSDYDYVIDAIDTVKSKVFLIEKAILAGVRIISSMGAGNKLDPTKFKVSDISKTEMCPLAKVMRRELRQRGINHLKVVFSTEPPIEPKEDAEEISPLKPKIPGSVAFVPSVAGLVLAGEAIKDLIS
jgi:tRNA A37 threonylcarbamoyladenosine dehydratase